MEKKRISQFFLTAVSMITLFVFNLTSLNLIGCGADEPETGSETEQLTDEEQKKMLRFVEYVLFPTTPYIDKSWVEIVPEDEVAEKIIDFATETEAIRRVYTEVYNAFNAGDVGDVLSHFSNIGFELRAPDEFGVIQDIFSKVKMRSGWLEGLAIKVRAGQIWWGPDSMLSEIYIRPQNVRAPYPEASAIGPNGIAGLGGGPTYIYLTKQGGKWSIHQLSMRTSPPSKYFNDLKYKAP